MAHHPQDDGFHEIQLNGKQLVFVFMAAALLSVVIFLLGVLVGRDVQRDRVVLAETDAPASPAIGDSSLDPARPVVPPTVSPGADPTRAAPPATPPAGEGRAASPAADTPAPQSTAASSRGQGRDTGTVAATATSAPPAAAKAPTPGAHPADAAAPKPTATTGDGPQSNWFVQVASVDKRADADSIAKRLTDKGYAAFVVESGRSGFRVRVGGFRNRSDADAVAAKLRRDERIEPWVTR